MKKHDKSKKEQKPRTPAKRSGIVELTDHELEQVQGGIGGETQDNPHKNDIKVS